jgi:hypothetical protein
MSIAAKMPVPLAALWTPLYEEVVWLHARWIIFRQLYGTSAKRIELLDKSAPVLFFILQNVLGDEIQLSLSKLADPAKTGKNRNLTLETLLDEIKAASPHDIIAELEDDLATFRHMCGNITLRRNKFIAHFDHDTVIKDQAIAVPGASRKEISEALAVAARFMNRIEARFTDSTTAYDEFIFFPPGGDAEDLADIIRRGLRYTELMESGSIPQDDIQSFSD